MIADHKHGVVHASCKHPDCHTAWRRWNKQWELDKLRGIPRTIDAGPVRLHLATLQGAGWSRRSIAAAAGVSATAVCRIADDQRTVKARVAAALLAVSPETLPTVSDRHTVEPFVPKVGTVRRLQALLALGYPHRVMRDDYGIHSHLLVNQQGRWVRRSTHDRVAAMYRQLAGKAGPSAITRSRAAKLGYFGPVSWDDIDLDIEPDIGGDTGGAHDVDEVVVQRRLHGDQTVRLNRAERFEVVRLARNAGWSLQRIEDRAGIGKPERYLPTREELAS